MGHSHDCPSAVMVTESAADTVRALTDDERRQFLIYMASRWPDTVAMAVSEWTEHAR